MFSCGKGLLLLNVRANGVAFMRIKNPWCAQWGIINRMPGLVLCISLSATVNTPGFCALYTKIESACFVRVLNRKGLVCRKQYVAGLILYCVNLIPLITIKCVGCRSKQEELIGMYFFIQLIKAIDNNTLLSFTTRTFATYLFMFYTVNCFKM